MPATSKAKAAAAPAAQPSPAAAPAATNGTRDKRDPLPGTGPITDLEAIRGSFADAPPAGATRGRGSTSHWPQVIEMLKANPGGWFKVGTYGTNGNRPKPLKDAGVRMQTAVGEPIDGHRTWDLWASFPG